MNEQPQKECCPKFDPAPWDGKIFEWSYKKFVKDKVFTLFYMPMNFGAVITRLMGKIEKAGGKVEDNLCLSDHTSLWNMDIYAAVDKDIPDTEMTMLSGKFLAKVYEGPFKDTGKWMKEFAEYAKTEGVTVKKTFMWYTTCPKCAKKYGKNYVVVVGEI